MAQPGKEGIMMEQDKAMNECIYKTHEGYCILHSDGIDVREYCVEGPCDDERRIENGKADNVV